MYCHTRKSKALTSLLNLFLQILVVLGGAGGVRDEAQIFLKRSLSL